MFVVDPEVAPYSLAAGFAAGLAADDVPSKELELPLPFETPSDDRSRFQACMRKVRTAKVLGSVGGGVLGAGTLLVVVGALAAFDGGGETLLIAGLGFCGVGAILGGTGQVMYVSGVIGAANALGIDNTLGWAGVGLAIGSVGATAAGALLMPEYGFLLGVPLGIASGVCFQALLRSDWREGRERGWLADVRVAPTPQGVLIAGRF